MFQADVLGAASAATGLLETAIRIIERVLKAYRRQQNLTDVLKKHADKLKEIRKIVQMIADEDALQTANVALEVTKLRTIETELVQCLRTFDPGSTSPMRQMAHQFVCGSRDEKTLADIMDHLDRVKSDICLCIQFANVGLTRTLGNTVLANAEVIHRIDSLLVQVIGEGQGLKLASLLKHRTTQGSFNGATRYHYRLILTDDGWVPLNKSEIAFLGMEVTSTIDQEAAADSCLTETIDRIIIKNSAQDSAVQILGPIGKDIWGGLSVRVEENKAKNKAVQVAYATDFETLKYLLERQDKI